MDFEGSDNNEDDDQHDDAYDNNGGHSIPQPDDLNHDYSNCG